jgi:hypothetical protein
MEDIAISNVLRAAFSRYQVNPAWCFPSRALNEWLQNGVSFHIENLLSVVCENSFV